VDWGAPPGAYYRAQWETQDGTNREVYPMVRCMGHVQVEREVDWGVPQESTRMSSRIPPRTLPLRGGQGWGGRLQGQARDSG